MHAINPPSVMEGRINDAIDLISEVMVLHNRPQFAPYVERLERELAAMRDTNDVMTRARLRLEQRRIANDNSKPAKEAA